MRNDFTDQLDQFATGLVTFCRLDAEQLATATRALTGADLDAAQEVLGAADRVAELRAGSEHSAFELLALQAPVARDLRQVVSGIYAVEHLHRSSVLIGHIAEIARRNHPAVTLPETVAPQFAEMARVDGELFATLGTVLEHQDVDLARSMDATDTAVDELKRDVMRRIQSDDWAHGSAAAVDASLLARYYERVGDHAVSVANRIIYLVTGEKSDGMTTTEDRSYLD